MPYPEGQIEAASRSSTSWTRYDAPLNGSMLAHDSDEVVG